MDLYYIFIVIAFVAVVLLFQGVYFLWNEYKGPEAERISRRLKSVSSGSQGEAKNKLVKQRVLSNSSELDDFLVTLPGIQWLEGILVQSGLSINFATLVGYIMMSAFGGMALAMFANLQFFFWVLFFLVFATFPFLFLIYTRSKRLTKIENQLPEAIDLMVRALKAGHAFTGTLQMVATEGAEPIASEFRITHEEINYGIALQDALMNLSTRIPSTDLRYLVIAVLIQRESGGNLAELLESISNLIRARLKLLGAVRVLSAEGRMSAWILSGLPFALAFFIYLVNPEFLSVLWTDPAGYVLIGGALGMMVVGIFVMSRIIKIRV